MLDWGQAAAGRGLKVVIAGAGGAAHLPGMLAAATTLPVIGVPVVLKTLDGLDSLLSIVQMPTGVPVATVAIGNAANAALLAVRILATGDPRLASALAEYAAAWSDRSLGRTPRCRSASPAEPLLLREEIRSIRRRISSDVRTAAYLPGCGLRELSRPSGGGTPLRDPDPRRPPADDEAGRLARRAAPPRPRSAQVLAGSRRLGRFALGVWLVGWAALLAAVVLGLLLPQVLLTLPTNALGLTVVQLLLAAWASGWLLLTVDTVRLLRLARVAPTGRGVLAGVLALALVVGVGGAGWGAWAAGVRPIDGGPRVRERQVRGAGGRRLQHPAARRRRGTGAVGACGPTASRS